MSEKIRILYYALWIAHPVLQTAIAIAMLRRGQHRAFKFFFAYIVTQIMTFAVVFPIYRYYYSAVFYVSWISTAISVALGFMVIHEAFLDVFRPFHTLRDLGTVLFKWAGLVMLLVAGVVSVSTSSSDMAAWVQAIMTAQRCVRIIQVGMVLFLLFFARYLGVSRRQHSFGIALGFGSLCRGGAGSDRVLGGRSPGQYCDEPDQHGRLQRHVAHLAGLHRGEESGPRRCVHAAAAAALGAEPVRHPAPTACGLLDPDVRRDGGPGSVADSAVPQSLPADNERAASATARDGWRRSRTDEQPEHFRTCLSESDPSSSQPICRPLHAFGRLCFVAFGPPQFPDFVNVSPLLSLPFDPRLRSCLRYKGNTLEKLRFSLYLQALWRAASA